MKEIDIVIKARDEERNRVRIIIEYLLNKSSKTGSIDYKKFYEDMEDFESSLID